MKPVAAARLAAGARASHFFRHTACAYGPRGAHRFQVEGPPPSADGRAPSRGGCPRSSRDQLRPDRIPPDSVTTLARLNTGSARRSHELAGTPARPWARLWSVTVERLASVQPQANVHTCPAARSEEWNASYKGICNAHVCVYMCPYTGAAGVCKPGLPLQGRAWSVSGRGTREFPPPCHPTAPGVGSGQSVGTSTSPQHFSAPGPKT